MKELSNSPKIDMDSMYVFFKNNRSRRGTLYDDFRFCKMETGDYVYIVIPASGHERDKGQAEVWGKGNYFKQALAEGTWNDIKSFFGTK